MIDTLKLSKLLNILKEFTNSKFIWSGDIEQLAPVEFGHPFESILSDKKKYNVHIINLKHSFRAKDYKKNKKVIKEIKFAENLHDLKNLIDIEQIKPDIFKNYHKLKYQIITHTNDDCAMINNKIYPNHIITKNTPILFKKNRYGKNDEFIYSNGMIAKIAEDGYNEITNPNTNKKEYKINIYRLINEATLEYSKNAEEICIKKLDHIVKSAAITVHAVQGSEYNNVLFYNSSYIINRNLLFTGCSRYKDKQLIVYDNKISSEANIIENIVPNSFLNFQEDIILIMIKTVYNENTKKK